MFRTLTLAIAIVTTAATAASARPDWPIGTNTVSFNASTMNALTLKGLLQNAIKGRAPLNGRVTGIELPPATGALN